MFGLDVFFEGDITTGGLFDANGGDVIIEGFRSLTFGPSNINTQGAAFGRSGSAIFASSIGSIIGTDLQVTTDGGVGLLGGPDSTGHPNQQGFDTFYGYLCQRKAHNYYPTHLWLNEERVELEGNEYFKAHQKIAAPLASDEEYWERYTGRLYAPDSMVQVVTCPDGSVTSIRNTVCGLRQRTFLMTPSISTRLSGSKKPATE